MVLFSHQFSKLQIYSVKVLNAFLSLHELKELVNDNANFVIVKDCYLLYWGIHWSQKDQIRFRNVKGIICTPKLKVNVLNQELKTIEPFNLVHGLKYDKCAYSPKWFRDFYAQLKMCNAVPRNHIRELQQTKPSAITTYANIPRVDRFCQFFVWLISFILDRKRSIALSVTQSSSPSPPNWYFKTHYTKNLC